MSKERIPFTLTYFGSLGLTLFFAVGLRTTIGTLVAAIVQVSKLGGFRVNVEWEGGEIVVVLISCLTLPPYLHATSLR
jgi:hypothetical protein